jgi:gliding motility-associated-like protein
VPKINISGAITPDGDQLNDTWYIKDIDLYPGNSISIYDRWGGLVYQVAGYDNITVAWDGSGNRGNNKLLPAGTYFYVINLGAGIRKITGAVELMR